MFGYEKIPGNCSIILLETLQCHEILIFVDNELRLPILSVVLWKFQSPN